MNKKYYFSVIDVVDDFLLAVEERIGVAAFYMDALTLVRSGMELIVNGPSFGDVQYVQNYLKEMKIPTDIQNELASRFHTNLNKKFLQNVHDYRVWHSYHYDVTELGDVCITDLGKVNPVVKHPGEEPETEDNWDYIPERMR